MINVFFNFLANNGDSFKEKEKISKMFEKEQVDFYEAALIGNYYEKIKTLKKNDIIIIAGGDGTLNRFINDIYGKKISQKLFLYSCGTGNDFLNDIQKYLKIENNLVPLEDFIKSLPVVKVNGMEKYFINGIGYGIDGYCCEQGDIQRDKSPKKVNYTKIAIMGMLGGYKTTDAKITVDGKVYEYKNVWLAPSMMGRFYGGGMMIAPDQDRFNKEKTITCVVCFEKSKLKLLMNFPKIFKGEHTKLPMIKIFEGHNIKVEYNRPVALQIDGETIRNVSSYEASYGE
ncbi:MAG: hypothetical protein IKX23_02920 [Treponema sp.]|nr:hypothetical protein [Treponema sp.]